MADDARTIGRQPVTLVELGMDRCTLTYGVPPCMAVLGVTGASQCFNTRATCQSPGTYTTEEERQRHCTPRSNLPITLEAMPDVTDVALAPTKIDVQGGIGMRSSITIGFRDHPHHDRGVDPYWRERLTSTVQKTLAVDGLGAELAVNAEGDTLQVVPGYTSRIGGTFWGRWRARHTYYYGRPVYVRTGYIGQDLDDYLQRTYLLDTIDGPDTRGVVTMKAKDPLKFADDTKALAPLPSNGALLSGMTLVQNTFTLRPVGIGEEYPGLGWVRIGTEVMFYARIGDAFLVERGQFNTIVATHEADDSVQLCLRYVDVRADLIAYDLLANYATVPVNFLPYWTDWAPEADAYLPRAYSTIITEPTPVKDLLTELTQQALFALWYDERRANIRIRAIRPPDGPVPLLTDDDFIADSLNPDDKPELRVTEAWILLGQIDPTEALGKVANYRQVVVFADLEAEGPAKFASQSIKKIFSRWITSRAGGQELAERVVKLFGESPRQISFMLDAKDAATIWTGDIVQIQSSLVQDALGQPVTLTAQIIQADETDAGHRTRYVAQVYNLVEDTIPTQDVINISVNGTEVNLYEVYVDRRGVPSGPVDVLFVIEPGVTIGMHDYGPPPYAQYWGEHGPPWSPGPFPPDYTKAALRTGPGKPTSLDFGWWDGTKLVLENNGRVQGRGGQGGPWPGFDAQGGKGGQDGFDALHVDYPLTLYNFGDLWGGGGGGSGDKHAGHIHPGGGGAGTPGGPGGEHGAEGIGEQGTATNGGEGLRKASRGGDPGLPGNNGFSEGSDYNEGAPGYYVRGNSLVTWMANGDLRGRVL